MQGSNGLASNNLAHQLSTLLQAIWCKVSITLCHLYAAVTQQRLHFIQAHTFVHQQAGEGVS
jgi:hypothetical protein